ncbi:hypothetical protein PDE_04413 [Penicillium oxalicum 114-2]|uniref:Allophanate hydrolase C-terminal domain-containing protein n=1 Tax=Penicillium oxalicum (strain 114-2 / CGMCC 5302) TaxID=933388 RepID=S8ATL6_PENO1|nr:hypothetical protein PDE_04413 [Penicillium oxalicum 114-2]
MTSEMLPEDAKQSCTISQWLVLQELISEPSNILSIIERVNSHPSGTWGLIATPELAHKQQKSILTLRSRVSLSHAVAEIHFTFPCQSPSGIESTCSDLGVMVRLKSPESVTAEFASSDGLNIYLVSTTLPSATGVNSCQFNTALSIPARWPGCTLASETTPSGTVWAEQRMLNPDPRCWSDAPVGGEVTLEKYQEEAHSRPATDEGMSLAVVGAHLSGFPLNKDLIARGATLELITTTTPCYRLYALQTTGLVRKPGLQRVAEGGESIDVEVWNMPVIQMGAFLGTVAPPLGIGSVELVNKRWVNGFICEAIGLENAVDITRFRGWRSYVQSFDS